jgi:hypothetical protein
VELDGAGALAELLASGQLAEWTSVLHHPEPLVVRWGSDGPDPGIALTDVLRTAPTVTVLVGRPGAVPERVVGAFDVCLTDDSDPPAPWVVDRVGTVVDAVAAQPLAAVALVAQLRVQEGGPVWAGLASESATYAALLGSAAFHGWLAGRRGPRRAAWREDPVLVERRVDRLLVTLNRPERHNAFDSSMRDGLVEALQLALADPAIATIELRGAGPSFSSGGDLDEFGTVIDPAVAHAVRLTRHPGWWLHVCRDRVSVVVHGACMGAGVELPAFAARVTAAPGAFFSLPEVAMGLIPGAGGTVSISRRIGRQRCAWLALSGTRIDAATARRWGLVDAELGEDGVGVGSQ